MRVVCLGIDISGRRRTELALRESEARFRNAFAHSATGLALVGIDGRFLKVNPALPALLGFSDMDLLQTSSQAILHPNDLPAWRANIQDLLAEKRTYFHQEAQYLHQMGHTLWAQVHVSMVRDPQKKPLYYFLQIQDISNRKQAEAALLESEARFRLLAENIDEVYWLLSSDEEHVLYISSVYEKITGRTCDDLYKSPTNWLKALHPDDRRHMITEIRRRGPGIHNDSRDHELRVKRSDGSIRWVWMRSWPVFGKDGEILYRTGVAVDITERKEIEEALRISEERNRQIVQNANEAILVIQEGRVRFANPRALSLTGYSQAALRAKPFADLLHPEDQDSVTARQHQLLAGKHVPNLYTFRIMEKKGETKWVQVSAVRITWDEKPATLNFFTDITDKHLADQAQALYAKRLQIMREIDQAILAARSAPEIAQAVAQKIRRLVPCQRVSVTRFDLAKNEAVILASETTEGIKTPIEAAPFSLQGDSQITRLKSGEIWTVDDLSTQENRTPLEQTLLNNGIRAYLNVPLIAQGELVGSLNLGAVEAGVFTPEYIQIAQELADPLALAIHQAHLAEQLDHHARELEARVTALRDSEQYLALLNDITRAALKVQDFKAMLQLLADRMGKLFNADGCFITLWDAEAQEAVPAAAYGPLRSTYTTSHPAEGDLTFTKSVLEGGKALIAKGEHHRNPVGVRGAVNPTRTILGLPLIAGKVKLGAALIAYTDSHEFSQSELTQGEQAASHIALAIAKAQLLDAEKHRRQEAETLRTVSHALVSTLDLDQVLDLILDQLAVVINYDSASVMLKEGDYLRCVAGRGYKDTSKVVGQYFPSKDSLFEKILETGQAIWLNDPKNDPRFAGWGDTYDIRSWMALPLLARGKFIGYMTLDSYKPKNYGPSQAALVQPFANQAAQAIENARLFDWVQRQAVTDALTGLYNRRGLFDFGQRELERAQRFNRPLTAIMLDIDLFKQVNDRYGHYIGDQVLCVIASRCLEGVRKMDLLARYGGEEFAVLLPETDLPVAKEIAERLRVSIANDPIRTDRGTLKVTISLGVAEISTHTVDLTYLLDAADQAMYGAKQAGRNCVRIAAKRYTGRLTPPNPPPAAA
jgi:diguanylate cyclase (GGDEF)-like protein/PAS domain S-box-containing protein